MSKTESFIDLARQLAPTCRSLGTAARCALLMLILISPVACSQQVTEAVSTPRPAPACFSIAAVQGYSPVGRSTVRLDVESGPTFEVDISGPQCDQIDWSHRLSIDSPSSSVICTGNPQAQGELVFRDQLAPQNISCHVDEVRVTPAD